MLKYINNFLLLFMSENSFFFILTLHFTLDYGDSDSVYFCNLVVEVFTCVKKNLRHRVVFLNL